jgi:hypothetical protein
VSAPIEMMLDGLTWAPVSGGDQPAGEIPHATHSGVLDLAGHSLRVYRLSDGRCVIDADDLAALFGEAP